VLLRPADKLSEFFLTRHERYSTGRVGLVSVKKRTARVTAERRQKAE
jgi:hypothetical protein